MLILLLIIHPIQTQAIVMADAAVAGKAWRRPVSSMLLSLLLALLLPIMARLGLGEAAFLGFGVDRVRRFAGHGVRWLVGRRCADGCEEGRLIDGSIDQPIGSRRR